jgi:glutamate--cysteine ligase
MRGADMGDAASVNALPALWVGLLYESAALEAAWRLVADWTGEERDALRRGTPKTALATPFRGGTVGDIARQVVAIARSGLASRARRNADGEDETLYLAPLEETLALGKTPAERWLDRYRGAWAGDLTRIFDEAEI